MHVELHPQFQQDESAREAADLVSACVHCGFCLATCPTYLDTGDERDSPRGRIYLVKHLLETGDGGATAQTHLDRCLTCRSCETTCPSGMQYGRLADFGRGLLEQRQPRSLPARSLRFSMRKLLARPALLSPLLRVGQWLRPLLPGSLKAHIPRRQARRPVPVTSHQRRMLVLEGCVQQAATPHTNDAARRVLDKLGISLESAPEAGCCGALSYHLGAHDEALDQVRRNIDAWWPAIEHGAEAIITSASGCGTHVADYGELLAQDPAYADKARRVSQLARDIGQVLLQEDLAALAIDADIGPVAVHTPCSLQHGLGEPDLIATLLRRVGFELAPTRDAHLCCGSAGTYSILQGDTSQRLRSRKLAALTEGQPAVIATGNVGCQLHLGEDDGVPVRHWIELLDASGNDFTANIASRVTLRY